MTDNNTGSERTGWWTFGLNVHIGVMLIAMLLVFGSFMVIYNQNSSRQQSLDAARIAFDGAGQQAGAAVRSIIEPVAGIIDLLARLPLEDIENTAAHQRLIPMLASAMERNPSLAALYFGHGDGTFFLLRAVRGDAGILESTGAPEGTAFVLQLIADHPGRRLYEFLFLDQRLREIARKDRSDVRYDPRTRGWYQKAQTATGAVMTSLYVYSTTRDVGVTMSRITEYGDAVVGADITVAELSHVLAGIDTGEGSRSILFNPILDTIAAASDQKRLLEAMSVEEAGSVRQPRISDFGDPAFSALLTEAAGRKADDTFSFNAGEQLWFGTTRDVDFGDVPMKLGIVVPASVLLEASEKARDTNLLASVGILLLSLPLAWLIGRAVARPMKQLSDETDRIGRFELDQDIDVRTNVTEIRHLAHSMVTMKSALKDFGRFVPRKLVRDIVTGRATAGLGGDRRLLSLMFTDVANFTSMAEDMDPQELMELTSEYLSRVCDAISEHGGTIDKYVGDAVMAFWNAPSWQPDHMEKMCTAAVAAAQASRRFDKELEARGKPVMFTRFGLHSGECVVGNVGSEDRINYTALGAAVNLASRVEGLNKVYGTQILATQIVCDSVSDLFLFRQVDRVVPKGVSRASPLYELLGSLDEQSPLAVSGDTREMVESWNAIYERFLSREWNAVIDGLEEHLVRWRNDGPAGRLMGRARQYRDSPPPDNWDGADVMLTK